MRYWPGNRPFKYISIVYSESDQKNVFLSGRSGQTRTRLLAADRVGFSSPSIHRNSTFGTIWTQLPMYTSDHLIACEPLPVSLKPLGLGHGSNETSRDWSIHSGALDAPLWRQRRTTTVLSRSCGFHTWEQLSRVRTQARVINFSAFFLLAVLRAAVLIFLKHLNAAFQRSRHHFQRKAGHFFLDNKSWDFDSEFSQIHLPKLRSELFSAGRNITRATSVLMRERGGAMARV